MELLRLKPVFKDTIWGGSALHEFGYEEASAEAGECWGISAHPNGDCEILNGEAKGMTLSKVYQEHRDWFGNIDEDVFPLLIKIIGAKEDLSIQVHPDDAYASAHENGALGKTECWYILDCKKDATIIIGHHAKDKEELKEMILSGRYQELIREIPIKPGDFFFIKPGCLHAIKGGTLLLETQQSSDVTYRVYDYDRMTNGKKRPLHVQESIDVLTAPFVPDQSKPEQMALTGATITTYASCPYFTVQKWEVENEYSFVNDKPFLNVSIIEGAGTINGETVKKGDHLILTAECRNAVMKGSMKMMVSFL